MRPVIYQLPLLLYFLVSATLHGQTDTVPPILKCKQGIQQIPVFLCYASVFAVDLVDTVYDNASFGAGLELGIRKACTGYDFPENQNYVLFNNHLENTVMEVWARDANGNTASCNATIWLMDPGACDPNFSILTATPKNEALLDVASRVQLFSCGQDTLDYFLQNTIAIAPGHPGAFISYGVLSSPGDELYVTPSKNTNPLNGITTADLLNIQKHLLGIKPLDSPYKIIAADVNLDGKVSTYDLVLLNKLLLGHISELPHGKSWRFVLKNFVFHNPANPFSAAFPEHGFSPRSADPSINSFYFIGVKIGDVDLSADPKG